MNRDDIIRMAESFGIPEFDNNESQADNILNFFHAAYAAGAAAEREACAKVCEEQKFKYEKRASKPEQFQDISPEVARIAGMTCDFNAAAIRAQGKK